MNYEFIKVSSQISEALKSILGVSVFLLKNDVLVDKKMHYKHVPYDASLFIDNYYISPENLLFQKLDINNNENLVAVAGPFPGESKWLHGEFYLDSAGNSFATNVDSILVTTNLIKTTFESLLCPQMIDSVNDLTIENINRIGATCADVLGIDNASSLCQSFIRVPPMHHFVNQLDAVDQEYPDLTNNLIKMTESLPSGFHLVDLAGRSLVSPTKYEHVCRIFRENASSRSKCVISDLTHLWQEFLQLVKIDKAVPSTVLYECPFGFKEIFCPIFCQGLVVGAVCTGQLLYDDESKNKTLESLRDINCSENDTIPQIITKNTMQMCKDACLGLAGLMASAFSEWSRAENASLLRQGMISASLEPTLSDLANAACAEVKRHVGVSECSIWQLKEDKLFLIAATSDYFFIRDHFNSTGTKLSKKKIINNDQYYYLVGEGLTGKTALTTTPLFLENARSPDKGWIGKISEVDLGRDVQFLGVPLRYENITWGVLRASKYAKHNRRIRESDIRFLQDIVDGFVSLFQVKILSLDAKNRAESFKSAMHAGAHELRQPLHNICSLSGVLARESKRLRESSISIHDKLQKNIEVEKDLLTLIELTKDYPSLCNRIVSYSLRAKRQMNNGLLWDSPVKCDFKTETLGFLFNIAEREFSGRGLRRNVRLAIWDDAKNLPAITMDSDKIGQVITNLLDNAFKYSFRGEVIHVHGVRLTNGIMFSVTDRGIGIPEKYKDTIFETYLRNIVEDETRFIDGSGMGLPIIKKILDLHGGSIEVKSDPFLNDPLRQSPEDGHEVVFSVFLPYSLDRG